MFEKEKRLHQNCKILHWATFQLTRRLLPLPHQSHLPGDCYHCPISGRCLSRHEGLRHEEAGLGQFARPLRSALITSSFTPVNPLKGAITPAMPSQWPIPQGRGPGRGEASLHDLPDSSWEAVHVRCAPRDTFYVEDGSWTNPRCEGVACGGCVRLLHVMLCVIVACSCFMQLLLTLPSMVKRNLSEAAMIVPERVETVPVDVRVADKFSANATLANCTIPLFARQAYLQAAWATHGSLQLPPPPGGLPPRS